MTREEAIDRLRKISEKTPIRTNGDDLLAITMAIQALSQEPCDDAVEDDGNRNQSNACSILDDECPYPHKHCWECPLNYQYMLAKRKLDKNTDLPSATKKSGKWIEKEGWDGDVYYECSMCGEPFCLIEGTPTDNMYNYCPNCGARMAEGSGKG